MEGNFCLRRLLGATGGEDEGEEEEEEEGKGEGRGGRGSSARFTALGSAP